MGADVELWCLDGGRLLNINRAFASDTFAYQDEEITFANSCYLIRHEREYMLWDTGLPILAAGNSELEGGGPEPLISQLARIDIQPHRISIIGISHWHFDHVGQVSYFPNARLLVGKSDSEKIASGDTNDRIDAKLAARLRDHNNVEQVVGDKDVFGDGSVIIVATPGHTLGHQSLLVRLRESGPIILSGDLWYLAEQIPTGEMSAFTEDRSHSLASMDRVRKIAKNLRAKIIVQHDMLDVEKLQPFPALTR